MTAANVVVVFFFYIFLPILNAASWNLAYGVLRGSEFFSVFHFFDIMKTTSGFEAN